MTKVYLEKDGAQYKVFCKDHANSEASCAAVSTLCYTLAGYLHNIPDLCDIEEEVLEPGNVKLRFHSKDIFLSRGAENTRDTYSANTVIEPIFDMICVGFLQLEHSYPGSAEVSLQEIE